LPFGDQLFGHPSYRAYACKAKEPTYFIQNVQTNIEAKMDGLKWSEEQLGVKRNEIKEFNDKIRSNADLKRSNDSILDSLRLNIANWNYKIKSQKEISVPEPVDLAVYEEEIAKLQTDIEKIQEQIETVNENSKDLKKKFEEANENRMKSDKEIEEQTESNERFKNEYAQSEMDKEKAKDAVDHYKSLHNDINKNITAKDGVLKTLDDEHQKSLGDAQDFEKMPTSRSPEVINNEIQSVEKQIKSTEKLHGSEEEICKRYNEMKTKYTSIRDDIKKQKLFLKKLKEIVLEREGERNAWLQSKSVRCTLDFSNLIASRDYNGTLKFDHINQKLDIVVHPNRSKENCDDRDLKSLSGGERSFSTVSFLLALWTIVESPLLFLDEFDVFMDQINRRFAMELIINTAKDRLAGQYVFLTPQEMGFIEIDEHTKCFKMPDPKRAIDMEDEPNSNISQ